MACGEEEEDVCWPASVDPLGEALHSLRMSGVFYCRAEFRAPWGLVLPAMKNSLMFHFVTSGRCWLEVKGTERRPLQRGDLALVPHGRGHRLTSEPGIVGAKLFELPRVLVSARYETLRHGGGGGAPTDMVCGAVRFDHPAAHHLVKLLPEVICVGASGASSRASSLSSSHLDWIDGTLGFMAAEARELRPGGETVITRLADVLVVQTIRAWLAQNPAAAQGGGRGWLGALQHRQIGRAIALIHRDPAQPWTLGSLAAKVAMSRSAFAARFTELVGESPVRYATRWRMHLALTWLEDGGEETSLRDLAGRLGYESEAAFNRAFKRFIGVSPGAVRRNGRRVANQRRAAVNGDERPL